MIRTHLWFYPGARMSDVATFVDTTLGDVRANWPDDAVEVVLSDEPAPERSGARFVLSADLEGLADPPSHRDKVRLLGAFDPYLQLRDREVLVGEETRRKDLWRTLGRPGAIVVNGEIVGTWRPRSKGRRLGVAVDPWQRLSARRTRMVEDQAERLAAHRGADFAGLTS